MNHDRPMIALEKIKQEQRLMLMFLPITHPAEYSAEWPNLER